MEDDLDCGDDDVHHDNASDGDADTKVLLDLVLLCSQGC